MLSIQATSPTRDLDTHEEVGKMVRQFYAKVNQDDLLGPMFNDVAQVDWPEHLAKLTAFWSRVLLGISGYSGNPFEAHTGVHQKRHFTWRHFERWLKLFHETLNNGWAGPNADRALMLAKKVAEVHSKQLFGLSLKLEEVMS